MTMNEEITTDRKTQAQAALEAAQEAFDAAETATKQAEFALANGTMARQAGQKAYETDPTEARWQVSMSAAAELDQMHVNLETAATARADASARLVEARVEVRRASRDAIRERLTWAAFKREIEPFADDLLAAKRELLRASEAFTAGVAKVCAARNAAISKVRQHHESSGDTVPLRIDVGSVDKANLIVWSRALALSATDTPAPIDSRFLSMISGREPPGNLLIAMAGEVAYEDSSNACFEAEKAASTAAWQRHQAAEKARGIEDFTARIHRAERRALAKVDNPSDLQALEKARNDIGISTLKTTFAKRFGEPFLGDISDAARGKHW